MLLEFDGGESTGPGCAGANGWRARGGRPQALRGCCSFNQYDQLVRLPSARWPWGGLS